MNLLAHLWLADRTATSAAGQILGDMVKGRLDAPRFDPATDYGIRLHRQIDSRCDAHAAHTLLRDRFSPPLRRYAGIIVDIGFDHALARCWPDFHDMPLPVFAQQIEQQVLDEWPSDAPFAAQRMRGLGHTLARYETPAGIQRALTSVSRRLRRANPLQDALPPLLAERDLFERNVAELLSALEGHLQSIR
ncbi:MAG: ACP phosphodiesterase [Salinisphaera sp.]|jgi:acyl carrier protein phosphodiesterase|nr:ACP phosphodiesterase [Salinisphaera sp.]